MVRLGLIALGGRAFGQASADHWEFTASKEYHELMHPSIMKTAPIGGPLQFKVPQISMVYTDEATISIIAIMISDKRNTSLFGMFLNYMGATG
jgi:hypothetical protein